MASPDMLTLTDADQLRDFADVCGRAAKTARRIAPANPAAAALLLEFAASAEAAKASAEAVAGFAEDGS